MSRKSLDQIAFDREEQRRHKIREKVVAAIRAMPPARLSELALGLDGHSIWSVDTMVEEGWPEEVRGLVQRHYSNTSNPKETIFGAGGRVVRHMDGIYLLDFAWLVAGAIGADCTEAGIMLGRGTQAQALRHAILTKLNGA